MMQKLCFSCGSEKEPEDFHKHRGRRDGRNDVCKQCANRRVSLYSRTEGARAARERFFSEYKERPEARDRLQNYHREYAGNLTAEQREKYAEVRRKRKRASPRYALYAALYKAAKRKPAEDMVTIDDLMEMWQAQNGLCAVSGIEMTWAKNGKTPTSISIDRIDGACGYERKNVRLVCWQVNLFKNCWSDAEMLAMAKAIVANLNKSAEATWDSFLAFIDESSHMVLQ